MRKLTLLFVALLVASHCPAATIIEVTNFPDSGLGGSTFGSNAVGYFSFTLGEAYNNVVISAFMFRGNGGTAYLTNSFGPGTTIANQVASQTFAAVPLDSGFSWSPLLSVSQLNSGEYFVSVKPNDGVAIGGLPSPVVFTAPGASVATSGMAFPTSPTDYPPSSVPSFPIGQNYLFTVTGDLASPAPVPEPASFFLVGAAMLVGGLARRLGGKAGGKQP